jgi:hypothetical protein
MVSFMENPSFLMDDLGVPLFQEPLFGEVSLRPQSVSHPWKTRVYHRWSVQNKCTWSNVTCQS